MAHPPMGSSRRSFGTAGRIVTKVLYGAPVAGQCTACHRSYEGADVLGNANNWLSAMFEEHICEADAKSTRGQIIGIRDT